MKLIDIKTNKAKKKYINFIYEIYKNDLNFKDTLIEVVKTFLFQNDTFTKSTFIRPVMIVDENEKPLAQCMYIYNPLLSVLQIGFFDALNNAFEAVNLLINEAKNEAQKQKVNKIVIGLNGHVSYGVGILLDNFDKPIPFDSLYNKAYYQNYFKNLTTKTLTTYYLSMENKQFTPQETERIYKSYSFRYLNLKKYEEEMVLFQTLCNETLKNTYLYFSKDPISMYELMKELKPFLNPENLIFAMKDQKEIGFIFWHPDYNEIIPGGKKNRMIDIGFRFLFHRKKIKNLVINAIGIIEPYKRSSVAMGLIYEIYKHTKDKFDGVFSNFVWDSNIDSTKFNRRNMDKEDRHYSVYEIELTDGNK